MMKKSAIITVIAFFATMVSATGYALEMPKGADLKEAAVELLTGKEDAAKDATASATEEAATAKEEAVAATADTASDAVATAEEAAPASEGFAAIDANTDGMISMDEAQAANNTGLIDGWSNVDTNADGQLDAAEFSAFEMIEVPAAEAAPAAAH